MRQKSELKARCAVNGGSILKRRNAEVGLLARNPLGRGLFLSSRGVASPKNGLARSRAGFFRSAL